MLPSAQILPACAAVVADATLGTPPGATFAQLLGFPATHFVPASPWNFGSLGAGASARRTLFRGAAGGSEGGSEGGREGGRRRGELGSEVEGVESTEAACVTALALNTVVDLAVAPQRLTDALASVNKRVLTPAEEASVLFSVFCFLFSFFLYSFPGDGCVRLRGLFGQMVGLDATIVFEMKKIISYFPPLSLCPTGQASTSHDWIQEPHPGGETVEYS